MSPWIEAAFAKYGWIWIGLTAGFAAKYALLIKRGVRIRLSLVVADLLLLPLVALLSYVIVERAGASGEMAAMLTALATVCADRLIKYATERFLRQVESEVGEMAKRVQGELRQTAQLELSGERVVQDAAQGKFAEVAVAPRVIGKDSQ